ncbi:hypothetical protein MOX02_41910 [Methylobacterium oxalidis]|uniref:DNA primase/polymerase bifunctional N-terminal domain-containing protein n=2 Tax=Methylobacterium oxalidis TaxID=944322 RepID=A0A512J899_9HYPH|nr:hypothetical protein MOX02_41910 [Methylobacterium oxalidis]GJE34583.1 hypothetical protein LDDCCGHA_4795 [Methylobacterium oxalidis]GLS65172.1 hypothetical protein GCM10007888_35540 [Methylobacterium oxalidis]
MPPKFSNVEIDGAPDFCAIHLAKSAANGFHVFPIPPGSKVTWWENWPSWCSTPPRSDQIARWAQAQRRYGFALACGHACIAIDIDEEDAGHAEDLHALAVTCLGDTSLVRFGRAPRRVLIYRVANAPVASRCLAPKVELIGDRRYVVAHGIHPNLGRPYVWRDGGPEAHRLADLAAPTSAALAAFAEAVAGFYGLPAPRGLTSQPADFSTLAARDPATARPVYHTSLRGRTRLGPVRSDPRWTLDGQGRVCDGREAFLTAQVWRAFARGAGDAEAIAAEAWAHFSTSADLERPRRDGSRVWRYADALAKAQALLRRDLRRPARRGGGGTLDFWTAPTLAAFTRAVDARGAAGALPPAAVAVSHAMTELARASGTCFASPATLATRLGLAERTVKQARARLVAAGLWRVANNQGGRARGADYSPDPTALITAPPVITAASPAAENGARSVHPSLPVGGDATLPEEARNGPLTSSNDPDRALGSPGSEAASLACRATDRSHAARSVAGMPRTASEASQSTDETFE